MLCCFWVLSTRCAAGKGADGSSKALKRALRLCLLRLEAMAVRGVGPAAREHTLQLAGLLLPFLLPRPKVSTRFCLPAPLLRIPILSIPLLRSPHQHM